MIQLGNFFFRYRNILFIFFYAALFIPAWPLFTAQKNGGHYYWWPIITGGIISAFGQLVRAVTIGLAYIVRGGKDGKVYADKLVTAGVFNHCRNPLYVGNIGMLAGIGIMANSGLYLFVVVPVFIFIYQSIVLAEEVFLHNKFGESYQQYCKKVSRWFINPAGLQQTFSSVRFNWKRYIIREYNTLALWLIGITLVLLFNYPEFTSGDEVFRNLLVLEITSCIMLVYLIVRYFKKTGKLRE